ncbi:Protein CL16A, partial [Kickxella alabastrina]
QQQQSQRQLDEASKRQSNAKDAQKRRDQIHTLAEYLSTAKAKRSTCSRIVESVRQVSELTIWCDRRNPEMLSLIIEQNLHQSMLRLLTHTGPPTAVSAAVAVQVLQTFSIILDGITDTGFLYALLSNNFVNRLITTPMDLDNDEVLPYYVAFLKALSLKLTPDTIHFFFNDGNLNDFPLYTTAISLFDHPDSMVRVAVRAITLNVFRINDRRALEFILDAARCVHFWEQIMHTLKDSYDDAFRILVDLPTGKQAGKVSEVWASIDMILENHMGLLAYLNDIYGLGVERINRRVTDEFNDRILFRTYVHAIEVGWRAGASHEESLYMQVVALFIAHFFAIIRYTPLLTDTINALFVYSPAIREQSPGGIRRSLSDAYSGDDPQPYGIRPGHHIRNSNSSSSNNNNRAVQDTMEDVPRLTHPFVLSPFESSHTLMPWLCATLEVLNNKAISPTTLVKSVLMPRRMLRTRALLESLTGNTAVLDCRSFSSSGRTDMTLTLTQLQQQQQPMHNTGGGSGSGGKPLARIPVAPLPPYTQTIVTSMMQVLADTPPAHNWITIDLAALLLVQLTRNSRGQIVLDPGMADELEQAHYAHSAELRAMLLAPTPTPTTKTTTTKPSANTDADADTDTDADTDVDTDTDASNMVARGSWKILVKCLVDFANSNADMLRNKVESQGRFIFDPEDKYQNVIENTTNLPPALPPPSVGRSNLHMSVQSAHMHSPFESDTPQDVVLAASIHQAYHLRRLRAALSPDQQPGEPTASANVRGLYAPDLHKWLGTQPPASSSSIPPPAETAHVTESVTVIDNYGKHALPKSVTRLGFPAIIACHSGCLYINQGNTQELVWPLADVVVTRSTETTAAGALHVLRLQDTPFPAPFYPPRPQSLGGINTATAKHRVQSFSKFTATPTTMMPPPPSSSLENREVPKKLTYTYFGSQRALDVSLRFVDEAQCERLSAELHAQAAASRSRLVSIMLEHNVI